MIELTLSGLDVLTRAQATLQDKAFVRGAVRAAGTQLQGAMRDAYPPSNRLTRKQVYGQSFQSDKQRRFFFWAKKNGMINVPYVRGSSANSERLKERWTMREEDNGFTVVIGNNASYGHWVMGDDQSLYMKAVGWPTARSVAMREWPRIVAAVKANMAAYLAAK